MKQLIFLGAGGFAKELYYWMIPSLPEGVSVKGFLSGNAADMRDYPDLPPHLGAIDQYSVQSGDQFILAIGDVQVKEKIVKLMKAKGAVFYTFVHPSCVVTQTVQMGEGCIICPLSVISNKAHLGDFVTINTGCCVGHDAMIGSFSVLSPMSGCMGGSQLSDSVFLGANALVGPRVKIGVNAKVSAGTTVLKELAANTLVAPLFAKILPWKR